MWRWRTSPLARRSSASPEHVYVSLPSSSGQDTDDGTQPYLPKLVLETIGCRYRKVYASLGYGDDSCYSHAVRFVFNTIANFRSLLHLIN